MMYRDIDPDSLRPPYEIPGHEILLNERHKNGERRILYSKKKAFYIFKDDRSEERLNHVVFGPRPDFERLSKNQAKQQAFYMIGSDKPRYEALCEKIEEISKIKTRKCPHCGHMF